MKMKKILTILLSIALSCAALFGVGCGIQTVDPNAKTKIVVAMPDGAPVLSVYELLKSVDNLDGHPVEYKIVANAQEIGLVVAKGEVDVGVMPTNVAAKLYNGGTDIKLLSVNVFGCLYLVGKGELTNGLNDLKGKVLTVIGKGASPDITMKLILDRNGISYEESNERIEDKVALRYVSQGPDAVALLANDGTDYAVLGEPVATNATKKLSAKGVKILLDLQNVWNGLLEEDDCFTQAGVVVAKSVYNDNELIEALLQKLESNYEYIISDIANVQTTLTDKGSALSGAFSKELIDRCNLKCEKAIDIKDKIEKYFNAVYAYDPTFIGGKLPADGFYWKETIKNEKDN